MQLSAASMALNNYNLQMGGLASIDGASICGNNWGIIEGNSNFLSVKIPHHTGNIKEWLVCKADHRNIEKIWSE